MTRSARGSKSSIWTGESWGMLGILCAVVIALMFLHITIANAPLQAHGIEGHAAGMGAEDRLSELRDLVEWGNQGLAEWSMLLFELCSDPELLTRRIHVDCENGTLTLPEDPFFASGEMELSSEGRELLSEALPIYLGHLRDNAWLWQNLESIEFRGHSDAYAERDPYQVNLLSSQARALSVLQFLTSDSVIPDLDQRDLMQVAAVSGASFSRPPGNCPTREARCRKYWRRVEIRMNLAEERTRANFVEYLERIRRLIDPDETGQPGRESGIRFPASTIDAGERSGS